MIDCNLKNIQEALNYLSKLEALESQHDFPDRSSPEQREYNQVPRIWQATEQNGGRRSADVQMRHKSFWRRPLKLQRRNETVATCRIEERTQTMTGAGKEHKTTVLSLAEDEI